MLQWRFRVGITCNATTCHLQGVRYNTGNEGYAYKFRTSFVVIYHVRLCNWFKLFLNFRSAFLFCLHFFNCYYIHAVDDSKIAFRIFFVKIYEIVFISYQNLRESFSFLFPVVVKYNFWSCRLTVEEYFVALVSMPLELFLTLLATTS